MEENTNFEYLWEFVTNARENICNDEKDNYTGVFYLLLGIL